MRLIYSQTSHVQCPSHSSSPLQSPSYSTSFHMVRHLADWLATLPRSQYLTYKLKYRRLPFYLCTLLLFPFHLLPYPVHPTEFSFCFFPGFLVIFTLLSSNNSINNNSISLLLSLNYYLSSLSRA